MEQHQPILVTGAAGFIGSNFVLDWIAGEPGPVVSLDLLTYAGNPANLVSVLGDPRHTLVQGDIGDRALVAALLDAHRPRAIVHFAAESHVDRSILGPDAFVQTNVHGTMTLLEATRAYLRKADPAEREAFRFLHVSTDEVYGSLSADAPAFQERTPYAPNSPYAASKAGSDLLVRAWHHTYGLPTLITNCSNNYGPFQFPEKLIPLMLSEAMAGRSLPVYGDGLQVRDWLYVGDHTAALRLILARGRPGESYTIGGDNQLTNLQVISQLCELLDTLLPDSPHKPHAQLVRFVTDRPGHDRRYAIDAGKLRTELGWRPAHNFALGLRRTVEWYLAHQPWMEAVRSGAYRDWMARNYASRTLDREPERGDAVLAGEKRR